MFSNRYRFQAQVQAQAVGMLLLALVSLLANSTGNPAFAQSVRDQVPDPSYDELYPYYVNYCSFTRFNPKGGVPGNEGGHAALYVKGLCRDEAYSYPRLKRCPETGSELLEKQKDPNWGVGVSLVFTIKSAKWTAIPGFDFFIKGGLKPTEPFTKEKMNEVIDHAVDLGIFKGIEFYTKDLVKPGEVVDAAKIERRALGFSLGTDFGVGLARVSYCDKIKIQEEQLESLMDYINEMNDKQQGVDYNFSFVNNNCTHFANNSLATLGIVGEKYVDQPFPRNLLNLAFPANVAADLAEATDPKVGLDADALYNNPVRREQLLKQNWLPSEHGSMLERVGLFNKDHNEMFSEDEVMIGAPETNKIDINGYLKSQFKDRSRTNLKEHLLSYKAIYSEQIQKVLKSIEQLESDSAWNYMYSKKSKEDKLHFYHVYTEYLIKNLQEVNDHLKLFR